MMTRARAWYRAPQAVSPNHHRGADCHEIDGDHAALNALKLAPDLIRFAHLPGFLLVVALTGHDLLKRSNDRPCQSRAARSFDAQILDKRSAWQ